MIEMAASKIIGNQGYCGDMFITQICFDGKSISLGKISKRGVFFPPNLKEVCAKLQSEGAEVIPFAQAALNLASKPAAIESDFF
jgi:hypothetical protein